MIYPDKSPQEITSISMAIVFANSLSGTTSYSRMKRIDYRSGLIFSLATIPGAILSAYSTAFISRRVFGIVFGTVMISASIFLFLRKRSFKLEFKKHNNYFLCTIEESNGIRHIYSYNPKIGVFLSIVVGYLSSLLGIGGGIIHVPFIIFLLNFPAHIATATSQFILVFSTMTGIFVHSANGVILKDLYETILLLIGVLIGAPLGAKISSYLKENNVIRIFAVVVGIVGIRMLFGNIYLMFRIRAISKCANFNSILTSY
jgi:uncharacterized membrane protein YfcA